MYIYSKFNNYSCELNDRINIFSNGFNVYMLVNLNDKIIVHISYVLKEYTVYFTFCLI